MAIRCKRMACAAMSCMLLYGCSTTPRFNAQFGTSVRANVAAQVTAAAEPEDPEREAVLAMALREAVTNVIRHAGARSCAIGLEAGPQGMLRLTVVDDGRGGEIREGSGLSGMRARLSAAGGALEVTSDARGTRLSAILPRAAA